MRNVFGSLQLKLIAGFVIVVLLAVTTVTVLTTRATKEQFGDFTGRWEDERQKRLGRLLATYHIRTGGWSGIREVIGKVTGPGGERLVVVDRSGTVVADSEDYLVGSRIEDLSWSGDVFTLPGRRASIGKLLVKPGKSPLEIRFLSSINRSALISGLVAGLFAITLAVVYSQRITSPVRSLTGAVKRMEEGDLGSQVDEGPGGEIGRLASAFNSMSTKLEKQERLRKNMVSDIAHELRTPLATIRGYLQIAGDGLVEPDDGVLDSIHREAEFLTRLVDDLQDLSLADAGKLTVDKKVIALQDVVNQVVERFARARADEKSIKLETDFQETRLVEADPVRIDQVIRNLLENAFEYTPEGGWVKVSLQEREGMVKVTVEDSGPGVPSAERGRIFDRFYRVDKSRSRETGGSGLGLTIASRIIRSHGGKIGLESEVGRGSKFWFTLPVSTEDN